MDSVYETYKRIVKQDIEEEESDVRCYWNDKDPKYINAVNNSLIRIDQLKMIDAFLEEHKKELDR